MFFYQHSTEKSVHILFNFGNILNNIKYYSVEYINATHRGPVITVRGSAACKEF